MNKWCFEGWITSDIFRRIQVRRTTQNGYCWRSEDELKSDVLLWTPTHGHTSVDRQAKTYKHMMLFRRTTRSDGRWGRMGRVKGKGSRNSVPSVQLFDDNDDDDDVMFYFSTFFICNFLWITVLCMSITLKHIRPSSVRFTEIRIILLTQIV